MLNLSASLISHIEQGRLDFPKSRAAAMIEAYGYTWKEYETLLAADEVPFTDPKDACIQMIDLLPEAKLPMVLTILRGFLL